MLQREQIMRGKAHGPPKCVVRPPFSLFKYYTVGSAASASESGQFDNLLKNKLMLWRQRGRVIRAPDLKFVGRGFKCRSDHYVVLGSPEFNFSAALVNSQLVCLLPVGILNVVMLIWIFIYHCLFILVLKSPNGEWPIKYTLLLHSHTHVSL